MKALTNRKRKENVLRLCTDVIGSEEEDDFIITQRAFEEISSIKVSSEVPEGFYLRLGIEGGGCTGVQYNMLFDNLVDERDRTYQLNGLDIVIDSKSLFFLMGITLDFVDSVQGNGFLFKGITNCPTCGMPIKPYNREN